MNTVINFYEGSYQFDSVSTPLNFHQGNIKAGLSRQYKYRPTNESLWAAVLVDGKEIARFGYCVKDDSLEAITFVTLQNFKSYCEDVVGVTDGQYSIEGTRFVCKTKSTRIHSFLINQFTQWKDTPDGYQLILAFVDIHESRITNGYFDSKSI